MGFEGENPGFQQISIQFIVWLFFAASSVVLPCSHSLLLKTLAKIALGAPCT